MWHASTRNEERGGNWLMFSHTDGRQGSFALFFPLFLRSHINTCERHMGYPASILIHMFTSDFRGVKGARGNHRAWGVSWQKGTGPQ
jgi:hypothetical protein